MKTKIFIFFITSLILFPNSSFSQLRLAGLQNKVVNDIATFGSLVFAATDSGIYKSETAGKWVFAGLANKKVTTVYPHNYGGGAGILVVSAGVTPKFIPGDSVLIYCSCDFGADSSWVAADGGIDRNEVRGIVSMDGFLSLLICGESYAAGNGKLYKRISDYFYKEAFDAGIGAVFVVKTQPFETSGNVWIGGKTATFAPFISRSYNRDSVWTTSYPDLSGNNACRSIELDPTDTNIVYAGMEGMVIKSIDGGKTWLKTSLINTPYYFNSVVYNRHILYAGGSTIENEFGLFWSTDKGDTWTQVSTGQDTIKGISSMVEYSQEYTTSFPNLFIATLGSGVYTFDAPVEVTEDGIHPISSYSLNQNYPNPFNPQTSIDYEVPVISKIQVEVFDLLGNTVSTLVNEEKTQGRYTISFNGNNLSSGIYFYRLKSGLFVKTMKMVLIR